MAKHSRALCCSVLLLALATPALARSAVHVGSIREPLTAPTALSVSEDQIAVLEPMARRILVFSTQGVLTQELDISERASGLSRLDASVYLFCDPTRGKVSRVDAASGAISDFLSLTAAPVAIVGHDGRWAILDAQSQEILEADREGQILKRIVLPAFSDQTVGWPSAMAWDASVGAYHVVDQLRARAMVVDPEGARLREYGSFGAGDGDISRIGGIACDADGYSYVSDRYQGRIAVFDPKGHFVANVAEGSPSERLLAVPTGVATDPGGILYVASSQTSSIEIFQFDKTATLRASLIAEPSHPRNLAVVPFEGLELLIGVRALLSAGDPLTIDVELDFEGAQGGEVASVIGLPIESIVLNDADLRIGEIRWPLPLDLEEDRAYSWRVRARTGTLLGDWSEPAKFRTEPRKAVFSLGQNWPNPFNPRTTIEFTLAQQSDALLTIFDVRGQRLWQKSYHDLPAGRHTQIWTGVDHQGDPVASGIYFYRLVAGDFDQTRKLALVR